MKSFKEITENVSDFFVYAIYHTIKDWYYNVLWYIKNRKTFDKVIREWRPWDYSYQIDLFTFGIEKLRDCILNGHEVDETRLKKVDAMNKLIAQLKRDVEEEAMDEIFEGNEPKCYMDEQDGQLRCKIENEDEYRNKLKKETKLINKLKKQKSQEIYRILVGQDFDKLNKQICEEIERIKTESLVPDEEKERLENNGYYDIKPYATL